MTKKPTATLLDERVVERHIVSGALSQTEYDAFLTALPDESENLTYTVISDDDEDEDDDFDDTDDDDLDDDNFEDEEDDFDDTDDLDDDDEDEEEDEDEE